MSVPIEAHLVCLALVAVDLLARSLRFRVLLRAVGHELSFRRALAIATVGDAACALTPYRIGGDVARMAALARAGVPKRRALVVLLGEAVQNWIVILTLGGTLGGLYGAAWWRTFVAGLAERHPVGRGSVMLACAGLIAFVVAIPIVRRVRRRRAPLLEAAPRDRPALPLRQVAATLPLAFVSTCARISILPVLMLASVDRLPSIGQALFGSFALLHGPMLLPTPAGAGAVEIGFLAQMRPGLGAARLLLAWRMYTSGLGVALGACTAGAVMMARLVRRHRRSLRTHNASLSPSLSTQSTNACP
jgi:uncharacterized membrane protein YbhN (UPF0104 family)